MHDGITDASRVSPEIAVAWIEEEANEAVAALEQGAVAQALDELCDLFGCLVFAVRCPGLLGQWCAQGERVVNALLTNNCYVGDPRPIVRSWGRKQAMRGRQVSVPILRGLLVLLQTYANVSGGLWRPNSSERREWLIWRYAAAMILPVVDPVERRH